MNNKVISLWTGQNWPPPIRGYLFLPDAFNRIGRMLYCQEWADDFACYDLLPVPPEIEADAPRGMRFDAHEYLEEATGPNNVLGYAIDYEDGPDPPPAQASLGLFGLAGVPLVDPAPVIEPSLRGRAPGFHFSDEHWQLFRERILALNEEIQRVINKVGVVTGWLFDEAFAGTIVPYVMNATKGGDWQPTTPNDWLMPLIERRRRRIQTCRLVPGQPAWPDGSHWIFVKTDELNAAMEAYQTPVESLHAPELAEPVPLAPSEALDELDEAAAFLASGFAADLRPKDSRFTDRRPGSGRKLSESRDLCAQILILHFGDRRGGLDRKPALREAAVSAWFTARQKQKNLPAVVRPQDIKSLIRHTDEALFDLLSP